jgi:hypothetical protein
MILRRALLAMLAGLGVLAAGCGGGPSAPQVNQVPTVNHEDPPCFAQTEGNGCLADWNFADEPGGPKAVWVDVTGYVPFPPTPSGRACSVPVMNVHPGTQPSISRAESGTSRFTLTAVYAPYRYGEHNQYQDKRQAGVAFTAANGSRYVAYYDYDDTLYRFARGYALVFTPCPDWAQG